MFHLGPCPIYDYCDFEYFDICGYRIDDSDQPDFKWSREKSSDDHAGDHSIENSLGHYMIAKSMRPHVKGRTTRLLTRVYNETEVCARFWYKIIGNIDFNVRIYTLDAYQSQTYFNATKQRGFEWALGQASISYLEPYEVT